MPSGITFSSSLGCAFTLNFAEKKFVLKLFAEYNPTCQFLLLFSMFLDSSPPPRKNNCLCPSYGSINHVFLLLATAFQVLCIHSKLIFIKNSRQESSFNLFHVTIQFSRTICSQVYEFILQCTFLGSLSRVSLPLIFFVVVVLTAL